MRRGMLIGLVGVLVALTGAQALEKCLVLHMPTNLWTGQDKIDITNEYAKHTSALVPVDFIVWSNKNTASNEYVTSDWTEVFDITKGEVTTLSNGLSTAEIKFQFTDDPVHYLTNQGIVLPSNTSTN